MSSNQPMQRAWERFVTAVLDGVDNETDRDIFMAGVVATYTHLTTSTDRTDLLDRLATLDREIDLEYAVLRERERREQA